MSLLNALSNLYTKYQENPIMFNAQHACFKYQYFMVQSYMEEIDKNVSYLCAGLCEVMGVVSFSAQ